jgi:hypothetical protein
MILPNQQSANILKTKKSFQNVIEALGIKGDLFSKVLRGFPALSHGEVAVGAHAIKPPWFH